MAQLTGPLGQAHRLRLKRLRGPSEALENRLKMYRVLIDWNWRLDPIQFIGDRSGAGVRVRAARPGAKNGRVICTDLVSDTRECRRAWWPSLSGWGRYRQYSRRTERLCPYHS